MFHFSVSRVPVAGSTPAWLLLRGGAEGGRSVRSRKKRKRESRQWRGSVWGHFFSRKINLLMHNNLYQPPRVQPMLLDGVFLLWHYATSCLYKHWKVRHKKAPMRKVLLRKVLLRKVGYSFRDLTFPCVRHSRHRRTETLLPGRCREQS